MRPTCAYCAKPAPKLCTTVWVHADQRYVHKPTRWTRHIHAPVLPVNIAACRRLSNQQVVSVRYDIGSRVSRFSEWDGESYWLRYDPCCTIECLQKYAAACHRGGFRMVRATEEAA
jgi:hypothetical protein